MTNSKLNIALIDVDGTKFPNIALMKIAAYHKNNGDVVEWYFPFNKYDIVYKSKVFTFTPDHYGFINNTNKIIQGGTGYDLLNELPIEIDKIQPDYTIYPNLKYTYGFITRGCPNNCKWCVVPTKEGNIKPYMDIEDITQNQNGVILMDNNILAIDYGIKQIEKIIKLNIKVDFNQGLDARLINNDIAKLLSKVKWIESIRFACDSISMIDHVINAMELLEKHGVKRYRFNNYLLLNGNINDAYYRATELRKYGATINAQPFRNFKVNNVIPQWQKDFARWCNRRELYKKIDFKEYEARKGFYCKEYFN